MEKDNFSIKETAIAAHEFYLGLIQAGFTQEQAIQLVSAMMMAAGKR